MRWRTRFLRALISRVSDRKYSSTFIDASSSRPCHDWSCANSDAASTRSRRPSLCSAPQVNIVNNSARCRVGWVLFRPTAKDRAADPGGLPTPSFVCANSRWENRGEWPARAEVRRVGVFQPATWPRQTAPIKPSCFQNPTAVCLNTRPPIEAPRLRRDLRGPRVLAQLAFDYVRSTPRSRLVEARGSNGPHRSVVVLNVCVVFAAITWSGSRTAYNAAPLGPSSRRRKTSPYTIPCGRFAAALSK